MQSMQIVYQTTRTVPRLIIHNAANLKNVNAVVLKTALEWAWDHPNQIVEVRVQGDDDGS